MNAGKKSYSIKELESCCGIKAHTIRMWEKRYGILTPDRSDTNIRLYTEDELKKIITISILNRNGIKISRIAKMNDEEILHAVMKNTSAEEESLGDFKPGQLIMSALRFSEDQFSKALEPHIAEKGLEEAYIRILYPLMQKARTLWLTDCLSKAQEQFIEYTIRKMINVEDSSLTIQPDKETVVIANMDEGNPFSNLLFTKYILKKSGFEVIFTDGTLTADDISGIQLIKPFHILVLNVAPSADDEQLKSLVTAFLKNLKLRKLIIVGRNETASWIRDSKTEIAITPADIASVIGNI